MNALKQDWLAYTGGLVALGLALVLYLWSSVTSLGVSASDLIQSVSTSALYYASALAGASTTGLGLLFTVIGLAKKSDKTFDESLYARVGRLSLFLVVMLVTSVLLLLILCLPLSELELAAGLYRATYYVLAVLVSLLTGLAVAVILILFQAVRQVLKELTPLRSVWGHTER